MKKTTLGLLSILCLLVCCSCRSFQKFTHYIYAMDTIITVDIYEKDSITAESHFLEIEKIYNLYDKEANDFKGYSTLTNIYTLNEEREGIVSKDLYELLEFAIVMKEETNGYFNPFIGRLSHLWKENVLASDTPVLPPDSLIQEELAIMNATSITFSDNYKIDLKGEGNLDLGAVAKGYATEKVYAYLDSQEVSHYLVNAGSSNIICATKPQDKFFKVGIRKMYAQEYYQILEIKNTALATTSYREQHKKIEDKIYTHVINPKTGSALASYASLSLMGVHSGVLDAYSTALYGMSLAEIKSFCEEKELAVLLYSEDSLLYSSLDKTL